MRYSAVSNPYTREEFDIFNNKEHRNVGTYTDDSYLHPNVNNSTFSMAHFTYQLQKVEVIGNVCNVVNLKQNHKSILCRSVIKGC